MVTPEQRQQARERIRAADCRAVAAALGAGIEERNRTSAQWAMRCPDPAHADAHASASVGVHGWSCSGCGAKGDVIAMAALLLGLDVRADFAELYHAVTGESLPGSEPREYPPRPRPPTGLIAPLDAEPAETPTDLVDAMQLQWAMATSASSAAVAAYLERKCGIVAERIDHALARQLTADCAVNRIGCGWVSAYGVTLIGAVYSPEGRVIGIRRRLIAPSDAPKEIGPRGLVYPRGGVYANSVALMMLSGRHTPRRLVIVEGLTDAIAWSDRPDYDDDPIAVLGMWSGSFHAGYVSHIPAATRVYVGTDNDRGGHAHAAAIRRAFGDRSVTRIIPATALVPAGADWCDLATATVGRASSLPLHAQIVEWPA